MKENVSTFLAEWQQQFVDAQEQRETNFKISEDNRTRLFDDWYATFKSETHKKADEFLKERQHGFSKDSSEIMGKLEQFKNDANEKHKSILELYGLVAGDTVAGGYLQSADEERKQTRFWRGATIAFIAFTSGWIAITYFSSIDPNLNGGQLWAHIAKAASLTAVLLFGAAYSSRQSSFHRKNEKRTRWFALEIKAIDPFIASLTTEQQQQLKKDLSERLFGQNQQEEQSDSGNLDPNLIRTVIGAAKDISRAAR